MAEQESGGNGTIFKVAGAGCAGLGCLMVLGAVGLLAAVAAGAFNYSLEGQATGGGVTSLCCGLSALLLGVGLLVAGRRQDAS